MPKQINNLQGSNIKESGINNTGATIQTQHNHLKINDINILSELERYIIKYKQLNISSPEFNIELDYQPAVGWVSNEDEVFEEIEKFIYDCQDLRLNLTVVFKGSFSQEKKMQKKFLKELENFIYSSKKDFDENKIEKVSYSKYNKIISENADIYIEDGYNDENDEHSLLDVVGEFFKKEFLHLNEYSSLDFYKYIESNGIDFRSIDFDPIDIKSFFKHKTKISCLKEDWFLFYDEIKDYDFEVMRRFLYTNHNFQKTFSYLKDFIKHYKYESYMYDEVDSSNPWCLHNLIELKSWNDENSIWWKSLLDNPDVIKEKDLLDDEFEKHMAQFRGDDEID